MRLGTTRIGTMSDRYSNDSQSGAGGSVLQAGGQTCLVAHLILRDRKRLTQVRATRSSTSIQNGTQLHIVPPLFSLTFVKYIRTKYSASAQPPVNRLVVIVWTGIDTYRIYLCDVIL